MLRLGLQTFFGGHHSGHKKGMGGFQEQALGRPEGKWERTNFSTHTEARRHLNSQSHWPMLTPPALELSLSPTLVFSSSAASASRPRFSRSCPQRLPRQPGRRGCLPWPGVSQHPTASECVCRKDYVPSAGHREPSRCLSSICTYAFVPLP